MGAIGSGKYRHKRCKWCGKLLVPHDGESQFNFIRRIFCDSVCSIKSMQNKTFAARTRKKREQAIKSGDLLAPEPDNSNRCVPYWVLPSSTESGVYMGRCDKCADVGPCTKEFPANWE